MTQCQPRAAEHCEQMFPIGVDELLCIKMLIEDNADHDEDILKIISDVGSRSPIDTRRSATVQPVCPCYNPENPEWQCNTDSACKHLDWIINENPHDERRYCTAAQQHPRPDALALSREMFFALEEMTKSYCIKPVEQCPNPSKMCYDCYKERIADFKTALRKAEQAEPEQQEDRK